MHLCCSNSPTSDHDVHSALWPCCHGEKQQIIKRITPKENGEVWNWSSRELYPCQTSSMTTDNSLQACLLHDSHRYQFCQVEPLAARKFFGSQDNLQCMAVFAQSSGVSISMIDKRKEEQGTCNCSDVQLCLFIWSTTLLSVKK